MTLAQAWHRHSITAAKIVASYSSATTSTPRKHPQDLLQFSRIKGTWEKGAENVRGRKAMGGWRDLHIPIPCFTSSVCSWKKKVGVNEKRYISKK
jgi:hypothetical protein